LRLPVFDPQSVPIDSVAGEAAIDRARLNLNWIRQRFIRPPIWQPEITGEHNLFPPDKNFTDASVLIAMVERDEELNLLFTRRTAHLAQHPGQISFPGGRVDATDNNVIETALREAQEEIGLIKEQVDVFGTLPDYFTATGYRVTPVVAALKSTPTLQSNAHEVAEIFEVPLSYLMNGEVHQRRSAIFFNQPIRRTFYAMPYQDYFIWGATAGMLRNLFHFLRAD
jgi:8-oxo-dGTP pyrophosphatase MutT (NUDIX family)